MTTHTVLVVDDSAFMRKIISDFISENPKFRVIDTARNGREAVEKVNQLRPDIVTMDVEMPEMDGLEALRIIMKEHPTPVIMLSSLTLEGAHITIQALEWGAFDFVRKPSGSISLDLYKVKQLLYDKLNAAAESGFNRKVVQPIRPKNIIPAQPEKATVLKKMTKPPAATDVRKEATQFEHIVAIGTSTGGPRALHQVISSLPGEFPAPVFVVQHMPPQFTKSLAQRLDSISAVEVVEAEDRMIVSSGKVYIAPGGWHMTVEKELNGLRIRLNKEDPRAGHRPSVDALFESLLSLNHCKRHIVIMTGMGSDGAKGMLALKQAGAETTIAEAEQTCVVYGMPRAAVELNAVMHVLPQQDIADKLIHATR